MIDERQAYLLLAAVLVFWAGNFPLSKLGLAELGPVTITAARAVIAAPLLLGIATWTAPLGRPLARRDYRAFLVLGLTGLVLNTTTWYWGMMYTTALNAGIIGDSSPIFVALTARVFLGDRLTTRNYVGIVLSVAAVLVTVAKGSLEVLLTLSVNRGDLIILASQTAWVVYSLYTRAAASTLEPVWIMGGAHVVSGVVLVPLAMALEHPWPLAAAPLGWLVVFYGVFPVTLGHLWYYQAVRTIGPGRAVAFLNLMPFAVIALSWAILGEPVRSYHLVGAVLVIAGVLLATRHG